MKKLLGLVLASVVMFIYPYSSVMASTQYSEEDYENAFNHLKEIRNKDDNFEDYIRDKFVAERFDIMAEQQGTDEFVLRYQDIPKKDREIFEYTYAYMKTTHVTKTTHPDNWINVYDRNEFKVAPYQIVEMSRSAIWLERMGEILNVLRFYELDKEYLPSNMDKSYNEFLEEVPMYMESLDAIINYANWVLAKPENELKAIYEKEDGYSVDGYPYDWFQHGIFHKLKSEAEVLQSFLTPISMMSNNGEVRIVTPPSKSPKKEFGGLGTTGILIGLIGGIGVSGYRRINRNSSVLWHIRNTILQSSKNIKVFSNHTKVHDVIKSNLVRAGVKDTEKVTKTLSGLKRIVPALRAAPFVSFFFDMKDSITNPNKTETDIRNIGEESVRFLVNGTFMIGGAFIGGEIGLAAGLAIGSPTGPGAVVTAVGGAVGGALTGSIIGDYVGNWVSDKVAHFGGDLAMNMHQYSTSHDNVVANFLKKVF